MQAVSQPCSRIAVASSQLAAIIPLALRGCQAQGQNAPCVLEMFGMQVSGNWQWTRVSQAAAVSAAGATGTGKTVYMTSQINALDTATYQNIQTAFSAQTSANQIQDIIDLKLDKRRKVPNSCSSGAEALHTA